MTGITKNMNCPIVIFTRDGHQECRGFYGNEVDDINFNMCMLDNIALIIA